MIPKALYLFVTLDTLYDIVTAFAEGIMLIMIAAAIYNTAATPISVYRLYCCSFTLALPFGTHQCPQDPHWLLSQRVKDATMPIQ
jgi:hypothetical protein